MSQIKFVQTDQRFTSQVAELRGVICQQAGDVLATCTDPKVTAILAHAAWAEKRRIIFAPTNQPEAVEEIVRTRKVFVLSGEERSATQVNEPIRTPEDSDILAEFYTSGSTGTPISVTKTARQLFSEASYLTEHFRIEPHDVLMSGIPARHLYGFLFSVMIPAVSGCWVVEAQPVYPASIRQTCERNGVTLFVSTPAQLRTLARVENKLMARILFSSGSALDPNTRQALEQTGLRVVEIFGSTETGGIATREDSGIWLPFATNEIKQGSDGNLHVRSPFLQNPAEFFACQDCVRIVPEGFQSLGRSDDIVKVGGKRVSLDFIKNAILTQPGIMDCAIFVQDDFRVRLHAFVVASKNTKTSTLRATLLKQLDPVTLPRIHLVSELPKTELGKVSKSDLEKLLERSEREIDVVSSESSADQVVICFTVHEDCRFFEGHFDDFPILSGIAQIKFVEHQIDLAWADLGHPIRYERLKFRKPILPNTSGKMTLARSGSRFSFRFESEQGIHTSGDVIYA
ncbi:AMP-binding protein [Microvenator marinus]|uniref:AMP-binding protein n=1 Tax=Microvenator marinus TaxID=2600177 RepID=A0A5B8XSZ6_9DELT|nr:AMP-binding protein [Microvenator marinus]QED28381.1 AMP-binding protein [Microvenator marinus]